MIAAPVVKSIASNEELAKRGEALYAELLAEGRDRYRYDPYQKPTDKATDEAIERIKIDTERRKHVHGPSIKREKFTSKYWRVWHREKTLLEDLSTKEIQMEAEAAAMGVSTKKKVKLLPRRPLEGVRASSFGDSFDKKVSEKYFDHHIIGGANTPSQLFETSHRRSVPVNPDTLNSTYDPENIGSGHNVRGGDISQSNYAKSRVPKTDTAQCDYPPMVTLVASNKGTRFQSAPRFPVEAKMPSHPAASSSSSLALPKDPDPGPRFSGSSSFVFPNEPRSSSSATAMNTPGPGNYDVPRLFEGKGYASSEDFGRLVDKYRDQPQGLLGLSDAERARVGLFGVGCNRQEHVLYGMCLDGRCCRRAEFESTTIRRNDLRRLAGYEAVDRVGRNKDNLAEDIYLSKLRTGLLTDAIYEMDPLYAAAHRGDTAAIAQCAKLGVNPNTRHPDSGYTPLHVAVAKCQKGSVYQLLTDFRGVIRLDVQDRNGDTALHVGSRLGYDDLVSLICDEPSCDPYCCQNNRGEYPMDINKSHGVYTHMKMAIDRNQLRDELIELKQLSMAKTKTGTLKRLSN